MFNPFMAEGITSYGRYSIKDMRNDVIGELNEKSGGGFYTAQMDTDSVAEDSLIYVSGETMKISDFYDLVDGIIEVRGEDNFLKHILSDDHETLSVNNRKELESKPIKYVMKHKVKKRMFRISCFGRSVEVTEDHSIIVDRNGILESIKPTEINKETDKIIFI